MYFRFPIMKKKNTNNLKLKINERKFKKNTFRDNI